LSQLFNQIVAGIGPRGEASGALGGRGAIGDDLAIREINLRSTVFSAAFTGAGRGTADRRPRQERRPAMPDTDPEEQREFYERRMREELDRAERAAEDGLRHLHVSWANAYRRRLDRLSGRAATPGPPGEARGLGSWTTDLG
jgi:hypothetical protein